MQHMELAPCVEAGTGSLVMVLGGVVQVPALGQETVVGPGPSPPTLISTESGSRIVRAGHKRYFFDLGSNNKGQYLRITEVRGCCLERWHFA